MTVLTTMLMLVIVVPRMMIHTHINGILEIDAYDLGGPFALMAGDV